MQNWWEPEKIKRKKYFLGIDPGLKYTGIAVIDHNKKIILLKNLNTENKKIFGEKIESILKKYKPELTALESVFTKRNPKEAIKLGENKGIIIFLLEKKNLKYIEGFSSSWKKAITGYGKAKSYQVEFILKNFLNGKFKKKLSEHEIDALGLAYFAYLRCFTE